MAGERDGALAGWRVLEVGDGVPAAFCGRVLADLGAEVLAVEPPGGRASRRCSPRRNDARDDEPGGRFLYLHAGKGSVVVESESALGRLAATADVVITDRRTTDLGALGALRETTIVVSITPFGSTGPYAGYRAHHLIAFHCGGEGAILPSGNAFKLFPDRAPVQLGGDVAEFDAGWNAAVATLVACYDRRRNGRGQRVDVSVQESELTLNRTRLSRFNNDGITMRREGNRYGFFGMLACRDGWVQLVMMTPTQWDELAASPEAGSLADPRHATAEARAADMTAAAQVFASWVAEHDRADVVRILGGVGAAIGGYARPEDLLSSAQLTHRGFLREIGDGRGGTLRVPGPPYRLSATPAEVGPAPALGSSAAFRDRTAVEPVLPPGRGLDGIRVLDFTWAAAGPYATTLLSLLGAEVVKVESTRRPDPARRGFLADYGGIDRSPNFNEINMGKRSFQVDLSRPEGLALARRLATEWADVVVDNFRPGVMARFGLDAAALLAVRPDLVVASSSANGSTGPEALGAGYASVFGATGGLSEQTGYADGPPCEIGESTDYRSANALVVGILAALLHRARTGVGQHVDLASREVVAASAPDALLAHQLAVPWGQRVGNRHREMAPHDVYPAADDDDWVAIAVGDDLEWNSLCGLLGHEEWAGRWPSADARRNAGDIDEAIAAWTRQRSSREAFEILQAAGVPAMAVMTNEALSGDPHLVSRGVFVDIEHPEIGRTVVMRAPWLFSDLEVELTHGPLIGHDNDHVLRTLLGLSEAECAQLREVLT
jgi:crotonobetainyl-CoA:carnitine CoA-transferase CaiB-like acyl-CoA transferase